MLKNCRVWRGVQKLVSGIDGKKKRLQFRKPVEIDESRVFKQDKRNNFEKSLRMCIT